MGVAIVTRWMNPINKEWEKYQSLQMYITLFVNCVCTQFWNCKFKNTYHVGQFKAFYNEDQGMCQQLRALLALPGEPGFVSRIHIIWLSTAKTPAPENPTSLSSMDTHAAGGGGGRDR